LPGAERLPRYVALWHDAAAPAARDALLTALVRRYPTLIRRETTIGIDLLCRPSGPTLPIQSNRSGSLLVLGRVFERGPSRNAPSIPADLAALEGSSEVIVRSLIDDHWGSYLAFLRDPATGMLSILRDPSGAVPAAIIGDAALGVVADQIPRWLHEAVAGPPVIDWAAVAAQLHDPTVASHRSFLSAVRHVAAGSLASASGAERPRQLWDPVTIATRPVPSDDRLTQHVRYTVDDSIRALTRDHQTLLLELSGGLDSAILLGRLSATHPSGPPPCFNSATIQASGDERAYARAAADHHGAILTEAIVSPSEMDYSRLADQADLSEPRLYGADITHERLTIAIAEALDASAIVTGQGGDAVFYQEPTPLVAADHIQARGLGRESWRTVLDSADRSRSSIWSVLVAARAAARRHSFMTLIEHDNLLLGPAARNSGPAPRHPWLADIEALPPGKRVQLQLLAACQFFRGPTARADRFTHIHPLLAQPVAELCLAIPSWLLSYGRLDRCLERDTFAADLPECIARRRGKGEVSTYYSHAIVANLPFLRHLLVDGLLAQRGLLDTDMLDMALSETSLVRRPDHRVIIAYASLEAWLRSWS
jgi:asparagine synthase (glutamine-hydrolysing)